MSPNTRVLSYVLIVSTMFLSGCAILGSRAPKAPPASEATGETEAESEQLDAFEARLRALVRGELRSAGSQPDRPSTKVINEKPHYYKEYFVYPNGEDDYTLEFTESESHTTPLSAEMNVEKIRFATRLHSKKEDARLDETFIRGTGTETTSYELRNGKWRRLGSLYVAEKTEKLIDGEWRSFRDTPSRSQAAEEESKSWWQRLMFWR